jgi:hypothetical protein
MRNAYLLAAALSAVLTPATCGASTVAAPLDERVKEGKNINLLFRQGSTAAHLVLRDGLAPRLLVAFPAGDSGVGVWFAPTPSPVHWRLGSARSILLHDAKGRPLRGVSAELEVEASELRMARTVLGSVRVLRDYEALHRAPAELDAAPHREGDAIVWTRDRIDGAPGYYLSLQREDAGPPPGASLDWRAQAGRPIRLKLVAATGETPLAPLDDAAILNPDAGHDPRARQSLAFLSYREKLLAGSWRFDTYFGRDTLMSVRLLLPVLKPEEAEAGLGAVLSRLSSSGEVAHEESIGEFAVMENEKAGRGAVDTPVYDYKMIDADYMLAPVLQAYGERFGTGRLRAFLATRTGDGRSYGELLSRNVRHVLDSTRPFAEAPETSRLLRLKPGQPVGQWRDSNTGLAGGRIPYDVNAVFAPAALDAIAELQRSGVLQPYLGDDSGVRGAGAMATAWRRSAPGLFRTELAASTAREDVAQSAAEAGVDPRPALASLPSGALRFEALSLDGEGRPIPVLNSDVSFDLLFGQPAPAEVEEEVDDVMRPFPAGLMTDVGAVVADAAYAAAPIRGELSRTAYHGAVVWAWQEAVLIAGLDRQMERTDLPAPLRAKLASARDRLWTAVQSVGETRTSELWSWAWANGRYQVQAFGAAAGDADESNAAQLWSTVFLALGPRRPDAR